MRKHFLVTISDDANILYGVRFLCSFFKRISEHQVTLLHICIQANKDMAGNLSRMWNDPGGGDRIKPTGKAQAAIRKATEILKQHGMPVDQVLLRTCAEQYGKVRDILKESARGHYDAVILGRRATYALQWMFERPADQIAQAIIADSCCATPLWICPEPVADRKNVLLCLDGSENGYRVADHVGFVLADQPHQKITLFLAETGWRSRNEELLDRGEQILKEHGVAPERISRISARGVMFHSAVQGQIGKGAYAATAVGLHGTGQEMPGAHKTVGSNTVKLISKIEKTSLWCCP